MYCKAFKNVLLMKEFVLKPCSSGSEGDSSDHFTTLAALYNLLFKRLRNEYKIYSILL